MKVASSRDYLDHLISQVDIGVHYEVLESMYSVEFYELVPNDSNREEEGLAMREMFMQDGYLLEGLPNNCTFLEMLIALAERMEFVALHQPDVKYPLKHWFWKLVENMDLYDCDDPTTVLQNIVERTYQPDGTGGIFPLDEPNGDQRELELWYQMMAWLEEKN